MSSLQLNNTKPNQIETDLSLYTESKSVSFTFTIGQYYIILPIYIYIIHILVYTDNMYLYYILNKIFKNILIDLFLRYNKT